MQTVPTVLFIVKAAGWEREKERKKERKEGERKWNKCLAHVVAIRHAGRFPKHAGINQVDLELMIGVQKKNGAVVLHRSHCIVAWLLLVFLLQNWNKLSYHC